MRINFLLTTAIEVSDNLNVDSFLNSFEPDTHLCLNTQSRAKALEIINHPRYQDFYRTYVFYKGKVVSKEAMVYTDGSMFQKNHRPFVGGWAFSINKNLIEAGHIFQRDKTNLSPTYMEICAIIQALKFIDKSCKVSIYSDCKTLIEQINSDAHIKGHTKVFKELKKVLKKYDYSINWIKGHSEDKLNEYVDKLAYAEAYLAYQSNLKESK